MRARRGQRSWMSPCPLQVRPGGMQESAEETAWSISSEEQELRVSVVWSAVKVDSALTGVTRWVGHYPAN